VKERVLSLFELNNNKQMSQDEAEN